MSAIDLMPTPWLWLHILAIALATYLIRVSFIGLSSYYSIPDRIEEQLYLVPPAVLSALAVPPLLYRNGAYRVAAGEPLLVAGLAGSIVAWYTENLIVTIATGFLVYYLVLYIP